MYALDGPVSTIDGQDSLRRGLVRGATRDPQRGDQHRSPAATPDDQSGPANRPRPGVRSATAPVSRDSAGVSRAESERGCCWRSAAVAPTASERPTRSSDPAPRISGPRPRGSVAPPTGRATWRRTTPFHQSSGVRPDRGDAPAVPDRALLRVVRRAAREVQRAHRWSIPPTPCCGVDQESWAVSRYGPHALVSPTILARANPPCSHACHSLSLRLLPCTMVSYVLRAPFTGPRHDLESLVLRATDCVKNTAIDPQTLNIIAQKMRRLCGVQCLFQIPLAVPVWMSRRA